MIKTREPIEITEKQVSRLLERSLFLKVGISLNWYRLFFFLSGAFILLGIIDNSTGINSWGY